eukprot:CAMPEP_0185732008 /NCGR_PEP_ID=MMETSP1171-20130828/14631_1 /TAXON_ID=374046 /ORGANISM="Helicotheca tamensis, Strain CCMP826" /LENGTH=207 /DNA_ID=CAMNT_0028401391 /DNA_START=95 /DNA_END=718 /DNA_ORIENTATION=-
MSLVATAAIGAHGLVGLFSPAVLHKSDGGEESSPLTLHLTQCHGIVRVAYSAAVGCLLYGGTTLNQAVGINYLTMVPFNLKSLWTNKTKKIGNDARGDILNLITNTFSAFALLTNAPYAETVIKCNSVWTSFIGFSLSCMPSLLTLAYGKSKREKPNQEQKAMFSMGLSMISSGLFFGLLVTSTENSDALIYSMVPHAVNMFFFVLG